MAALFGVEGAVGDAVCGGVALAISVSFILLRYEGMEYIRYCCSCERQDTPL